MEEAMFGLFGAEQENGDEVLECTDVGEEEYVEEQEQVEYHVGEEEYVEEQEQVEYQEEEEEEEEEGQQYEESACYDDYNGDANVESNNDVEADVEADVEVNVDIDIDFNKQSNDYPQKQNQNQNQGTWVTSPVFTTDPMNIKCSFCHVNCMTRTSTHPDAITITLIIVIIFIFWPLFWLPLVIPGCKTTVHHCSSCNQKVGSCNACSS